MRRVKITAATFAEDTATAGTRVTGNPGVGLDTVMYGLSSPTLIMTSLSPDTTVRLTPVAVAVAHSGFECVKYTH